MCRSNMPWQKLMANDESERNSIFYLFTFEKELPSTLGCWLDGKAVWNLKNSLIKLRFLLEIGNTSPSAFNLRQPPPVMQWRIKRAIYSVYEIFEKNLGAVGATGKFLGAAVGWVNCDSGGRGSSRRVTWTPPTRDAVRAPVGPARWPSRRWRTATRKWRAAGWSAVAALGSRGTPEPGRPATFGPDADSRTVFLRKTKGNGTERMMIHNGIILLRFSQCTTKKEIKVQHKRFLKKLLSLGSNAMNCVATR